LTAALGLSEKVTRKKKLRKVAETETFSKLFWLPDLGGQNPGTF